MIVKAESEKQNLLTGNLLGFINLIMLSITIFSNLYALTKEEVDSANKAYKDGFYEIVDKQLGSLIYELIYPDKLSQDAAMVLAFSAFQQKNSKLSESILDKILISKPLYIDKYETLMLKLNILLLNEDFYLAEKTFNLIWYDNFSRERKLKTLEALNNFYISKNEYGLSEKYINELISTTKDEINLNVLKLALMECLLVQKKLGEAGNILKEIDLNSTGNKELKQKAGLLAGRLLLGDKDYDTGVRQYLSLYETSDVSNSTKQEALFGLCLSYWNTKNYIQAKESILKYIEQFPFAANLGSANLMLSQIYLQLQEYAKAEIMLLDLTEEHIYDEIYFKSLYWLGEAYYRQKKYDQAVKVFEKLNSLKGVDIVNMIYGTIGLAWVKHDITDYENALTYFDKVSEIDIEHPFIREAKVMKGNCLYLLKRYDEAKEVYSSFLDKYPLSPTNDEIYYKLGLSVYKKENLDETIKIWETLFEKFPKSKYTEEALWRLGNYLYENGSYAKAIDKYNSLINSFSNSEYLDSSRLEIGNCYYNQCLYSEALLAYELANKSAKNLDIRLRALYYSGWCHYLLKEENEAIAIFQNFLEKHESSELSPQVLFWLGEYEYNRNNYKEAKSYFHRIIDKHSDSDLVDNSYFLSGKSSFNLSLYEEVISDLSMLIVGFPKSDLIADAHYLRGEAYFKSEKNDDAIDDFIVFETAFEDSYLRKNAFIMLGDIYSKLKQYTNAIIFYEKANKINASDQAKDDSDLLFKMAVCYKNKSEINKAVELGLKLVYNTSPRDDYFIKAIEFCVEIYKEQGEYNKAVNLLTKLIDEGKEVDKKEIKHKIRKLKYYDSHRKENP
ncbi:MAG: outer membrane assembly lipoprotein YfiO [uncultured bacterium]|nr:MAG: outer membrane assembly lipoprotein YfiO [uncultured bacterium]